MTVRVVTDSTSDLPPELLEKHGITAVPLNVHFGQTVYLDGIDITPAAFFEKLRASETLPTTSQPSPGQFEAVYRELAESADEILSLHISSKLSGTTESAMIAAKAVADRIHVEVVNSEMTSVALGVLAMQAAEWARQDVSAAEIAERLRALIQQTRLYFFLDTLEYLRRGGRIGKAQAFLGTMFNVKPLLQLSEGIVQPLERVRTRSKAVERLIAYIESCQNPLWLGILGDVESPEVKRIREYALARVGPERLQVAQYGPVIGVHVGPGAVGVALLLGGPR